MTEEELLAMELHERKGLDDRLACVMRVPGGWLYEVENYEGNGIASTFVPEPSKSIEKE